MLWWFWLDSPSSKSWFWIITGARPVPACVQWTKLTGTNVRRAGWRSACRRAWTRTVSVLPTRLTCDPAQHHRCISWLSPPLSSSLLLSPVPFPLCSSTERAAASQHSSGPPGLHRRGPRQGTSGHHAGARLLFLLLYFLLFLRLLLLSHHVAPHHLLRVHHLLGGPPALRQSPEQPPLHGQPHDGRDLRQAGTRGRWGGFWGSGIWLDRSFNSRCTFTKWSILQFGYSKLCYWYIKATGKQHFKSLLSP